MKSLAGNDTPRASASHAPGYREKHLSRRRSDIAAEVVEEKSFDIAPSTLVKPGYGGIHFIMSKLKITLTGFMFPLVLLFGSPHADSRNPKNNHNGDAQSGTLQKMVVENGSVTMDVDLNGLNGSNSLVARPVTLQFARSGQFLLSHCRF